MYLQIIYHRLRYFQKKSEVDVRIFSNTVLFFVQGRFVIVQGIPDNQQPVDKTIAPTQNQ